MACATDRVIEEFEKEGLEQEAARYLAKYPDSPEHLTLAELREQIIMHPDARHGARAGRTCELTGA